MMYKGGKIWKQIVQVEAEDQKGSIHFDVKLFQHSNCVGPSNRTSWNSLVTDYRVQI